MTATPVAPTTVMPTTIVGEPTVAEPVELEPVVVQPSVEPAILERTVVDTRRRISPSAVVATAAAIVLMLWGAVVAARAGLTGDLDTPIVEVTSYRATAVLGLIALGGGFLLLLAGLARRRAGIVLVSVVLAVGAATLVIEPTTAERTLAAERDFGIAALIVVGITAIVALLSPDVDRVARRERIR